MKSNFATIEELFEEARQGRPYIMVDMADQKIAGDIVLPADFVTGAAVNFMARYARGLVCLALSAKRATELKLKPMTASNQVLRTTAFAVSIEAKVGVTTGISAFDRAHTIAVAVDPTMGADDIVSPGHVFPIVVRDGGVLERAECSEAAVDMARLAGLKPAAVICKIMDDEGATASLPYLCRFAKTHGLKIGAISDLIAHRRRTELVIERIFNGPFDHHLADDLQIHVYRDRTDGSEHVALVRGCLDPTKEFLVRIHHIDVLLDCLDREEAGSKIIDQALAIMSRHVGSSAILFIQGVPTRSIVDRLVPSSQRRRNQHEPRDHSISAQILKSLGIQSVRLLTTPAESGDCQKLAAFGLSVRGSIPIALEKAEPFGGARSSLKGVG